MATAMRLRSKAGFAACIILVLAGMTLSWLAGYVSRSPLGPGEPLAALIPPDAVFVARCPEPAKFWKEFRHLPRYEEYARTDAGGNFLRSNPAARAARRLDEIARSLWIPRVDLPDLISGEVVVAGLPGRDGPAVLVLARLRPAANVLLGIRSLLGRTELLPIPSGEWWMAGEEALGVAWTKVGDVLAASDDPAALARFAAIARQRRPSAEGPASILLSGGAPEFAVRLFPVTDTDAPGPRAPWACVVSLHLGQADGLSSLSAGRAGAKFAHVASAHMPADTCAGMVLSKDAVAAWKLIVAGLPEREREKLLHYADERLAPLLDVDDFERDGLGRLTGDLAVAVSPTTDPWLHTACGINAPTVSAIARVRADESLRRNLPRLLVEVTEALRAGDRPVAARLLEEKRGGRNVAMVEVVRDGRAARAGCVLVPDAASPGYWLLLASTSVEWLDRALSAGERKGPSLGSQRWFHEVSAGFAHGRPIQAFFRGDRFAGVLSAIARHRRTQDGTIDNLAALLNLLGAASADGVIDADGVIRLDLRVTGASINKGDTPLSPGK